MHLTVHLVCRAGRSGRRPTCGIVLFDEDTARPVHEAGYCLEADQDEQSLAIRSLLHALDLASPLNPEQLNMVCDDARLVDQLTVGAAVDQNAQAWFAQAVQRLLRMGHWQIVADEEKLSARARQVAEQAGDRDETIVELDRDEAAQRHRHENTGVPQFTAELLENPAPDCPARCQPNVRYPFGPDTPAGFCVHAAAAVLADGPLNWPDPEQQRMTTICPHCEVPIRIEKAGGQ